MPNLPCGYPGCAYTTGELNSNAAAAVLNSHTVWHTHMQSALTPAKREKVPRPTIDSNCTTAEWSYFESRWNEYKNATQLNGQDITIQLLACCTDSLRRDLYRTHGSQIQDTEQKILTDIRNLTVQEENTMVARVTLSNMRQDDAEKIPQFIARLKGQTSICKYTATSQCSGCQEQVTHSYMDEMVRDVLIKGITDSDIRQDILGEMKQDMSLDQVTKYILAKLQAKQSASHLSGETTAGAVRSSHRRRKFQNTESSKQIPKKDYSATKTHYGCKYCGETGHGTNLKIRPKFGVCPAIGNRCPKCNIFNHTAKVCRQRNESAAVNDLGNASPSDDEAGSVHQLCSLSDSP